MHRTPSLAAGASAILLAMSAVAIAQDGSPPADDFGSPPPGAAAGVPDAPAGGPTDAAAGDAPPGVGPGGALGDFAMFMPRHPAGQRFGEGVDSNARGTPLTGPAPEVVGAGGPEGGWVGAMGAPREQQTIVAAAPEGEIPDGIEPLPRDLFTSDDFYVDRELWSNPLYWRCNSPLGIESMHGDYFGVPASVTTDIEQAPWGYCDRDYPREALVSPYEFKTAQEQFDALLAEATAHGGPTVYSRDEPPPDWEGRYIRNRDLDLPNWFWMQFNQVPTILSLLTDEYQTRFVQHLYHNAVSRAAQWPASYCWPEGLMRWWSAPALTGFDLHLSPDQTLFIGGTTETFLRTAQIGREFRLDGAVPYLSADNRQFYGEAVGFWDGDVLVTWTSNIRGWLASHGAFEFSSQLQIIEIYTPRTEDGKFVGLHHEAIFYDPEAFVQPIRMVYSHDRTQSLSAGAPYNYLECLQTIFPIEGVATPVSPGAQITIDAPDWLGRPWAQEWQRNFEQGMQRPEDDVLAGF